MGQRPAYNHRTSPLAFRATEDVRRIFEWLTLETGAPSVAQYLRSMAEQHLVDLGFTLEAGVTAALPLSPPAPDAVAAWQQEEADRGPEPDRAVG